MDENLLLLLIEQPEKGLEKLMNSYLGLVYTIVRNKLYTACSDEDIEECVSGVFFEAYENRNNIDLSKGSLKAFLSVIAKRRAIDLYRKNEKRIENTISFDDDDHRDMLYSNQNGHGGGVDKETKSMLISCIKDLGQPDSEIFIRKYYFGESTKTIAKALGIKGNTIDKKVSRGLARLKDLIEGVL
ncbi:MAG: sigma-70 family RNA polymerase sigma factor [Bacillota bacterium]|nr:sigma-70 family RNA polymerase sigma factor [Bacillota bacterium]